MTSPCTRQSKFRHIYGEAAKMNCRFLDLNNPMTSGESSYVKACPTFIAFGKCRGGAPIIIHRTDNPGRIRADCPTISVHKGKLMDFDFHPFHDNIIGSCSDDCSVRITHFPKQGLDKSISEADVTMNGHRKKVVLVKFHPTADSIIASASFDRSVKVWNIEKNGSKVCDFKEFKDNLYSIAWNVDGSLIAATAKDKILRMFDPRKPNSVMSVQAFDGMKSSKCFWVPSFNWVGCCGFSRNAKRQLKLWDIRMISNNINDSSMNTKPIYSTDLDHSASVLVPEMDMDLNILYLAGKGDGTISYYELCNDSKKVYALSSYRNSTPQKGGGWMPKRGLDVYKCEIQRFYKLTSKYISPISFIVPRKSGSDAFQSDIFPDCMTNHPALNVESWLNGANRLPKRCSMDPGLKDDDVDEDITIDININCNSVLNNEPMIVRSALESKTEHKYIDREVNIINQSSNGVSKEEYNSLCVDVVQLKERVQNLESKLMEMTVAFTKLMKDNNAFKISMTANVNRTKDENKETSKIMMYLDTDDENINEEAAKIMDISMNNTLVTDSDEENTEEQNAILFGNDDIAPEIVVEGNIFDAETDDSIDELFK